MKNLLKKAFLLLALVGGAMSSWADPAETFSIRQDLGNYILIGQDKKGSSGLTADGVTLTGCKVDKDGTCYNIGSTGSSTVIQFKFTATAGNYVFSFKSGTKENNTSTLALVLAKEGESGTNIGTATINSTGSWDPVTLHSYILNILEAATYTLTMTMTLTGSGSNGGNFANFNFHTPAQYASNWNNTTNIIFTDAEYSGNSIVNDWINSITKNSYVEFYTYTPTAGFYYINAKYGYATAGTDNFTMTITDVATSTVEVSAANYKVNGSEKYPIANSLAMGWKKIHIDYPSTPVSGSFRCQGMKFGKIDYLPLTGSGNTLDLSLGIFGTTGSTTPSYEDANKNIGNCKDGGYAIYYVNNTNETAYYNLSIGIKKYNNGGTLKVTVTDVATSTTEVDGEELVVTTGSNYELQTLKLSNAITSGLKEIRFDFVKPAGDGESDNFLFNFNNVSFDPISVTGTITPAGWSSFASPFPLDLSTLKATNDVTAYYASAAEGSTVTLTPTGDVSVPAGEGLMIKGTAGDEFTIDVTADAPTFVGTNLLKGQITTGDVAASGTDGKYHYVFGYKTSDATEYGFYNLAADTEVSAGKAYLEIEDALSLARALSIVFDDDILTGIEKVDNGEVKSSLPVKRIVNGKLVIEKKGMMFNANGQVIK